ncbi:hypothetical protein DCAR_0830764 [Daucus carota subsp. sativus]|uniref:Replication protein A 70 kDa DNA-binding subunit B/D first OB fold domain-containing protein n=1 Tax=Daucus carota subsp. sativus TaxID=79200 RepID=A0A175YKW3_DAUCS|nr:hypothetical protein DCAR_0830764 [Daucus carota subsp. sativus]
MDSREKSAFNWPPPHCSANFGTDEMQTSDGKSNRITTLNASAPGSSKYSRVNTSTPGSSKYRQQAFEDTVKNLNFEMDASHQTKKYHHHNNDNFEDIEYSTIRDTEVPDADCYSNDENEDNVNWCSEEKQKGPRKVWKGVNKKTKEFRGYNIIFTDDSNCRIHAFVSAQLCSKLQTELVEGQVFVVRNFAVKKYNGDETHRAVRNETHIYFTQDTKFVKDSEQGLEIMPQTIDLFKLSDVDRLKQDNRYLIDVVGVLEGTPSKIEYKKDELHHFYVKFSITDGREKEAGFYVVDIDDSDEDELPHVTVKELLELKHDYIKQCVQSRVILRKVEQHMNWYYKICTACDVELDFDDKKNQCPQRKKILPYPDKRFRLFTLCSDNTGTVPITLPNEEVVQLIGRTVYDILADDNEVGDGDKFPGALTGLQKKYYDITISISEENVKQGSQVFNATKISKPLEISATNSPGMQTSIQINSTAVPTESAASKSSPPTGNSRTKTRARKRKNVKVEKNCRMQAYVPAYLSDKWKRLLRLGNMYTITNFNVKTLTADDKWRTVNIDRQISFTNQTRAREIIENEYFIPQNTFDFYSFNELDALSNQKVLLADIVGIVIKLNQLHPVHTSTGKDQLQVKLKMTDGRNKLNVTFWDEMAVDFQNQIDTEKFERPLIVIVSSAKVSKFRNEIDVCNYAQTAFYINYNHHNVADLRKMTQETDFTEESYQTKKKRRLEFLSVKEINNLSAEYIEFKGKFPTTFKKLENAQSTVKLKIHKDNIGNSEELYLATDIYPGFEREEVNEDEETTIRPTEHSISELSTSASYHLDNISQLKGN